MELFRPLAASGKGLMIPDQAADKAEPLQCCEDSRTTAERERHLELDPMLHGLLAARKVERTQRYL